jgi:hypothetical protein
MYFFLLVAAVIRGLMSMAQLFFNFMFRRVSEYIRGMRNSAVCQNLHTLLQIMFLDLTRE